MSTLYNFVVFCLTVSGGLGPSVHFIAFLHPILLLPFCPPYPPVHTVSLHSPPTLLQLACDLLFPPLTRYPS